MEFSPSKLPKFSIVFFPKTSSTELKIPAHVSEALQESITLRDKWYNIWQVKARKIDRQWYLLGGWAEFVGDNSLTYMDVLYFTIYGPGSLDVDIVGTDGIVKEGVGYRMIYMDSDDSDKDKGKGIMNKVSENEEEDESEEDSTELIPRNEPRGRGRRVEKESDESENVDTLEKVSYEKNKRLEYNNFVKAKGKKGKEIFKNQNDTDEYETDDDFAQDGGYWDGKREDESEESDKFESVCKKLAKELRKYRNDKYASTSRKPHQKKRNIDRLSKGILKSGLAKKPKRHHSAKRMKHLCRSELNKGKGIVNKVSKNEEEDDSEEESTELIPRNERKGRGRVKKELRADVRAYTVPDSDSDYRSSDSYEEVSEEDFRSRVNGLENAKKLNEEARDVTAPKGMKFEKKGTIDYTGAGIFQSGLLPWPECTYFVTKMKPKRMKELHIPRDIYIDDIPERITLVDPRGKKYTSRLDTWSSGRSFYREGWDLLCKSNHITANDFCICAFGEGDQKRHIYVSFVRVEPDD